MHHIINGHAYPVEFRVQGNVYRVGALMPDGKFLHNAIQLPDDTPLTEHDVKPVLAEINRQLLIQFLEAPQLNG